MKIIDDVDILPRAHSFTSNFAIRSQTYFVLLSQKWLTFLHHLWFLLVFFEQKELHCSFHYFTSNCLSYVHISAGWKTGIVLSITSPQIVSQMSTWAQECPVKLSPRHIIQTFAVYNHLVLLFASVISSFVFVYGSSSESSFCTSATPSCEHEQFMEVFRVILHLHYSFMCHLTDGDSDQPSRVILNLLYSYMWYQTIDGDSGPSRVIQHLHNFFTCYLTWWRRMLNVVLHLHDFFYFV